MRKLRSFLIAALCLAAATAADAQTTVIGRQQLVDPDLHYPGGSGLHTLLDNMFITLSDNANSRYKEYTSVANNTTSTYTHNLGIPFSQLLVVLYSGTGTGKTLIANPAGAGWTIAANIANPTTKVDVTTPTVGGPWTFTLELIDGLHGMSVQDPSSVAITGGTISGVTSSSNMTPTADNTYDLGTSALRWRELHVGPSSVVFHNDTTNTNKVNLQVAATGNRTLTLPDASDTLVGRATTDTLTNKTLSGNTATSLVNGSGTFNFNSSGTVTVPNATDSACLIATAQTLTNKTISGSSNTLTVLAGTQLSGQTPIANGGTGQSTSQAAVNALSQLTTKGDVEVDDGTNTTRLGVGSDGTVLTASSGAVKGLAWTTPSITSFTGTLPVSQGGTGDTTLASNGVMVGAGTSAVTTATGSANQVLFANASGVPTFGSINLASSAAVGTSILPTTNGGTGVSGSAVYPTTGTVLTASNTISVVNKNMDGGSNTFTGLDLTTTVTGVLPTANGGTGVNSTAAYPSSGTVVTEGATETLTSKTLTTPVIASLKPDGSHTLTMPIITDTLAALTATQTLTNKTLTSPQINTATMAGTVVSDYLNLVEIATPANPAAGSVRVYSKSGDSLYTLNSAGTETQVGSGSGQKNYLQAGSNTATTWAASGAGITVTTDTTAADLPRANTTKTGIKITSASGSGVFVASDFVLDTADYNTKLQVQFSQACGTAGGVTSTCVSNDFKVDVYSCTSAWTAAGTCAGTQTRLALSTDSSSVSALPALNGTYGTTFDAPGSSAANIEVRIGTNATHTHSIVLSDVVVGPGIVTQGAAGTSWSSYTPVVTGLGSGTTTTLTGVWRREFDSIHVRILHVESGTAGTGATSVKWSLPTFATINYSAMISTAGSGQDNVGSATTLGIVASSQADRQIQIFGASSTTVGLIKPLTSTSYQGSDIAANAQIYFDFTVPVNEWAGAGTVNVVQNGVTYYSCTGTTWGTSAGSCTTAIGPSGVQGGTTTPSGTSFTYSFTPTYPIPVGVSPELEVSGDQTHWTKVGGNWTGAGNLGPLSYIPALTALCGASVHAAGGGQLVVSFGKYVDANSTPWSGTWYWRVSVGLPGQAVGFSSANATSSGLIDTQTQTFAGDKTFNGSITRAGEDAIYVFNAAGNNPLSSATLSPVVFATTFVDQTSAFSSNTYTCKHAGIYRVAFDGSLNKTSGTSTAGDFWNINIRKNGAAINAAELQMSMGYTTGQDIPFHTEVLVSLAVNDTVTAAIVYNAGGARTWVGNADNVNLVITKI